MNILKVTAFLAGCCHIVIAQPGKPLSAKDSLQLQQYTDSLNFALAWVLIDYKDTTMSDEMDYDQVDRILSENRTGYTGGSVYYAPDGEFKIFVIEGESCGAYCNPMFASYVVFRSGKSLYLGDDVNLDPFRTIQGLYKTAPHTYIAIHNYWTRGAGVHSENNYVVSQFLIKDDTITTLPFVIESDGPFYYKNYINEKGQFGIYTLHHYEVLKKTFMTYAPKKKKLSYGFVINYYQAKDRFSDLLKNENQVLVVSGSFALKKGVLSFTKETYQAIDFDEN